MNVYPFIEAEKHGDHNVKRACELLEVSRSAYYAHRAEPARRPRAARRRADRQDHRASTTSPAGTYGSPRIHARAPSQGVRCSRKRVARLMRAADRHGRTAQALEDNHHPRPGRPDATGPDRPRLRDRPRQPAALNTRWCGDITYVHTWEGWLYLATVIDLASRRVVGWAVADHLRTDLIAEALTDALAPAARTGVDLPLRPRLSIHLDPVRQPGQDSA